MSWRQTTLRSVAEVALGRQRAPEHASGPNMTRYLRAANVTDGHLQLDDVLTMNFSPKEQAQFSLRYGDILVTEGSGSLGAVGASAVYRSELDGTVCFQNTLLRLRPRTGIDGRFLGWWARSAFASGLFASIASGANIHHISAERVRALRISMPGVDGQRRIADFLDAEIPRIDTIVEAQRKLQVLLAERRVASISELLSGANSMPRKLSRIAWLGTIPASWESTKVSFVARVGSGHTPSRSHPEWWQNCVIPWITTGEVSQVRDDRKETILETRENISVVGLVNSAAELCPAGTVVLCRTAASAGYSAVMGSNMATSQDFVTWTCGPRLDPYYLLWCLRAMRADLLNRLAMGSTHKTIYFPDLQSIRIPLPSVEEQRDIVEKIRQSNDRIDRLMDSIDRQLGLLAERRQALITAAVTGQFEVTTARSGVR